MAQLHLLEPPTGSGNVDRAPPCSRSHDFMNGFASNRDEILQATDCNVGPFGSTCCLDHPGDEPRSDPRLQSSTCERRNSALYLPTLGNPSDRLYRDDHVVLRVLHQPATSRTSTIRSAGTCSGSPPQRVPHLRREAERAEQSRHVSGIVTRRTPLTPATPVSPLLDPLTTSAWVLKFSMMADHAGQGEREQGPAEESQCCDQRAQGRHSDR